MGLSNSSVGIRAVDANPVIKKRSSSDRIIALGGNPNVGKSTIFNALTGLNQHTGNWPGKTVTNAMGYFSHEGDSYILVDLPGCYSLMARSAEEETARDFICFGKPDAVIIVCDATCLERNLNLVLQTLEITPNVVVCVNLIDEAEKKGISIDYNILSEMLGIPVVYTAARSGHGLKQLMDAVSLMVNSKDKPRPIKIQYPQYIETAISAFESYINEIPASEISEIHIYETAFNEMPINKISADKALVKGISVSEISANNIYEDEISGNKFNIRWLSLMLLLQDSSMVESIKEYINKYTNQYNSKLIFDPKASLGFINEILDSSHITKTQVREDIASSIVKTAEGIFKKCVSFLDVNYQSKDIKIDKVLTGKWTAFPIMIAALLCVFWLTISGANYPSQLISNFLFMIEDYLFKAAVWTGIPEFICEMLIHGVYRVLAWVVSVMLPPMAIFFPLFTLLEDSGFLPRIAFNLDKCFKKCSACGKQALTMCMAKPNLYYQD